MSRSVFRHLVGQERVADFLCAAIASGQPAHAYLFVGPHGSGKREAAIGFACALQCPSGGCDECPACSRVRRGAHPDVHLLQPSGSAHYLVEQIRDELVPDVWLAPAEGPAKVYVLDHAEALGESAASAFLKTLEEPPPSVTILLLADDLESVLPTIVSRCQIVRFAPLTPARAISLIDDRTGAGPEAATQALAAAGGSLPDAIEHLLTPARGEARERMLQVMRDLEVMDGADVLDSARDLLRCVRAPLDEIRQRQEAEQRERVEFMGRAAGSAKDAELRNKRELTAREREGIAELLNVAESWLRDVAAASAGRADLIHNRDAADEIEAAAAHLTPGRLAGALSAVAGARRRVSYNVSPQLAVEAMLFEIQEARSCPQSWEST